MHGFDPFVRWSALLPSCVVIVVSALPLGSWSCFVVIASKLSTAK